MMSLEDLSVYMVRQTSFVVYTAQPRCGNMSYRTNCTDNRHNSILRHRYGRLQGLAALQLHMKRRCRTTKQNGLSSDENITQSLVKTDNRSAWYHNLNKKDFNQRRTTRSVRPSIGQTRTELSEVQNSRAAVRICVQRMTWILALNRSTAT